MGEHERGTANLVCLDCQYITTDVRGDLGLEVTSIGRIFCAEGGFICPACETGDDFGWLEFTRESDGVTIDE